MMKTAKLVIDGSEYCDIEYMHDRYLGRYLGNCVDLNLQDKIDLSEYNDGDSFEWHAENDNGEVIIRGMATVNFTPSVTVKVNDD